MKDNHNYSMSLSPDGSTAPTPPTPSHPRLKMDLLVKLVQPSIPITLDGNSLISISEPNISITIVPTKEK